MSLSGGRDEKYKRKRGKRTASKMSLSGGREEEEGITASKMSPQDRPVSNSLEEKCVSFLKKELKRFKRILSPKLPEKKEAVDTEEEKPESIAREGALKITLHILRNMNHMDIADLLQQSNLFI
ncbi:hypothetical protein UPYG_G00096600 [Umbra pygmaea]|uniref:Uncharacterized protein n=1 Tax=Umbra pygmaea TaxID=75934 RepID=A0ABD0X3Z9_UMBPY